MLTWVEIKAKAIQHNILQFRRLVGTEVKIMPVIKSNAYGHGFLIVAKLCETNNKIDRICVVSGEEAGELIKHGIKKPIQILSFYELNRASLLPLIKHKIIFPVYTSAQAIKLNQLSKFLNIKTKIHIKVDTGTTRVGILSDQAKAFAKIIKSLKFLEVEGIWSHFAASESDFKYTNFQRKNFEQACQSLKATGIAPKFTHMSCSSASALFSLDGLNAIRLGLSLYGLYPADQMKPKIKLKPALSWFTTVIQVKTVPAGTKVGYGCTYTTKKPCQIIVLPIGYWDGYDRKLSNLGQVIINGIKYPIRGRICMNLTMVEAPLQAKIRVGDKVTIIGKNGQSEVRVDDLARQIGTINYEVVTRINPLIPRLVR
ncbi:MAG: alanine racemase [bacterium]|nr:alanine racemase [bacterium]